MSNLKYSNDIEQNRECEDYVQQEARKFFTQIIPSINKLREDRNLNKNRSELKRRKKILETMGTLLEEEENEYSDENIIKMNSTRSKLFSEENPISRNLFDTPPVNKRQSGESKTGEYGGESESKLKDFPRYSDSTPSKYQTSRVKEDDETRQPVIQLKKDNEIALDPTCYSNLEIRELLVKFNEQIFTPYLNSVYKSNFAVGKDIFLETLCRFLDKGKADYYEQNFDNETFLTKDNFTSSKLKISFPSKENYHLLLDIIFDHRFKNPIDMTSGKSFGYIYVSKALEFYDIKDEILNDYVIKNSDKMVEFGCGIGVIMKKLFKNQLNFEKLEGVSSSDASLVVQEKLISILSKIKTLYSFSLFVSYFDFFFKCRDIRVSNKIATTIIIQLFSFMKENKQMNFARDSFYQTCIDKCFYLFSHYDYSNDSETNLENEMMRDISKQMYECLIKIDYPDAISHFFRNFENRGSIRTLKMLKEFVYCYSKSVKFNSDIPYSEKLFVEIYNRILFDKPLPDIIKETVKHQSVFVEIIKWGNFKCDEENERVFFNEIFFSFFDLKYIYFLKILFENNIFNEKYINRKQLGNIPDINNTIIFYLKDIAGECFKTNLIENKNNDVMSDIKQEKESNTLHYILNCNMVSSNELDKFKTEITRLYIVRLLISSKNPFYRKYLTFSERNEYFILNKNDVYNDLAYIYIYRRELRLITELINKYNKITNRVGFVSTEILKIDDNKCFAINDYLKKDGKILSFIDEKKNNNYKILKKCVLKLALGFMLILEHNNQTPSIKNFFIEQQNTKASLEDKIQNKFRSLGYESSDVALNKKNDIYKITEPSMFNWTNAGLLTFGLLNPPLAVTAVASNLSQKKDGKSSKRKSNRLVKHSTKLIKRKSNRLVKRSTKRKSTTKRRSLKRKIH